MLKYPNLSDIPSLADRYIVLDTETTGLFCDSNHILEIAAIEVKNGFLTGNQFHAYLKPRKNIESKAQEIHNISELSYKQNHENFYESDKIIMQNLLNFIGDSIVFAHNASFDLQFVNYELNYWNLPEIPVKNFRCTLRIFKSLFFNSRFKHDKGHTLSGCCQFFNIKFDDKSLHSAVYDATLTAKLVNSMFEFLVKNPEYLSKKVISNYSYLEAKKALGASAKKKAVKSPLKLNVNVNLTSGSNNNNVNNNLNNNNVEKAKSDFSAFVQVRKINMDEKNAGDNQRVNVTVVNSNRNNLENVCDAKASKENINNNNNNSKFNRVLNNQEFNNLDPNENFLILNSEPNFNQRILELDYHLSNNSNNKNINNNFNNNHFLINDFSMNEIENQIECNLNKIELNDAPGDLIIYENSNKNNFATNENHLNNNNNNFDFLKPNKNNVKNILNSNSNHINNENLNFKLDYNFKNSQNKLIETRLKNKISNSKLNISFEKQLTDLRRSKRNKNNITAVAAENLKENKQIISNELSVNEYGEKTMEIDYLDNEASEIKEEKIILEKEKNIKINSKEAKSKRVENCFIKNKNSNSNSNKSNTLKDKSNKIHLDELNSKIPKYKQLMKNMLLKENL